MTTVKIIRTSGPATASTSTKSVEEPETHQEPIFTQTSADLLGIINLEPAAAELAEFLARQTLKETLRLARNYTHRSARHRMTVADLENTIKYTQNTGHLNISTVDTLNMGVQHLTQIPGTSGGLYSFQKLGGDVDVDREDTETFVPVPRDLRIIAYPLVTEGQPVISDYTVNVEDEDNTYFEKNAVEVMAPIQEKSHTQGAKRSCLQMFREAVKSAKHDQKVGLKPSTMEILTVEQQVFMKDIITVCMGQDDKKRGEALTTLEEDAGVQVILPYLTERICKSIAANISQRCLSLIIYAGRVLRAISRNKSCDMTVALHHVLPALLSCCVGRNMCTRPESDNHWALRDFSAKTLYELVRDQVNKRDNGFTSRRIFDFSYRIFKDSSSSVPMIYGSVHILSDFASDVKKGTSLLAELHEMSVFCKNQIEGVNRTSNQQLSVQEAAKLSQQLTKAENSIRTRFHISVSTSGPALNRRFF